MTKQEFLAMSLPYKLMMYIKSSYPLVGEMQIREYNYLMYGNDYEHKPISIKPILRPLSDLIKEIEHKGEKFVPIVKLMQIAYESQDSCIPLKSVYVKDNMYTVKVNVFEFAFDIDDNSFISILNNSFSAVPKQLLLFQKLTEWHFDIANLISKGEAIDVNTLEENPYK